MLQTPLMWENKCWDQTWAQRGDSERDDEADLITDQQSQGEEEWIGRGSKQYEEKEKGCMGRVCLLQGPDESVRQDSSLAYQTSNRK